MIFFSSKPEKIGRKIVRRLCKERKSSQPIPYELTGAGPPGAATTGEILKDTAGMLLARISHRGQEQATKS